MNICQSEVELDYQEWDQLSYAYALTIKDIINLKPGQQIKVVMMDRNVWDCLTDCIKGKSYKPNELLSDNWAIYIHEEGLRGKLVFWFNCKNDEEQINVDQPNFEFHIEYTKGSWYPLKEEYLPGADPQGFSKFPWDDNQKQHWTSFPETTCVGWRGHFVLWSKLDQMPNIGYN